MILGLKFGESSGLDPFEICIIISMEIVSCEQFYGMNL